MIDHLTTETRQLIKSERDKILRSLLPTQHFRHNDGWCYYCDIPIDLEQGSKYCSSACREKHYDKIDGGYPSNIPNR